jgi:hypothetical protein
MAGINHFLNTVCLPGSRSRIDDIDIGHDRDPETSAGGVARVFEARSVSAAQND